MRRKISLIIFESLFSPAPDSLILLLLKSFRSRFDVDLGFLSGQTLDLFDPRLLESLYF